MKVLLYTDEFKRQSDRLTRVKKIQGRDGVWEARASRELRITFSAETDIFVLRSCGHHDKTLRDG